MIRKNFRGGWLDDAYLGGERTGCKQEPGAAGKTPFVAAVKTTEEPCPIRVKLSVVKGFRSKEVSSWAAEHLTEGGTFISDGLACFNAISDAGCSHNKILCGGGRASVEEPEFYSVNTISGNLKRALHSTYDAVRPKYAQRYPSDFQYRFFNRRFDLSELIPKLAYAALRTTPRPEKLLKVSLG